MAKQQDLTLNTGKLSGSCGRLMCCLGYEYHEGSSIQETRGGKSKKQLLKNRRSPLNSKRLNPAHQKIWSREMPLTFLLLPAIKMSSRNRRIRIKEDGEEGTKRSRKKNE